MTQPTTPQAAPAATCRYSDCYEYVFHGGRIADEDETVTCPDCREYMGLPPLTPKEARNG